MINYSSINDAWGYKEIYKKNTLDNILNQSNEKPKIQQVIEPIESPIIKKEHFNDMIKTDCALMEHIKTCETCKNKLAELFGNSDNSSGPELNIFGLKLHITKDVLKLIFILLIILIFIILLSIINFPFKNSELKYLVIPNQQMNQMLKFMNA